MKIVKNLFIIAVLLIAAPVATMQSMENNQKKRKIQPKINKLNLLLINAVKNGNLEEVQQLIVDGADIDYVDKYGSTPLVWAACKGHPEITHYLVNAQADVNKENPLYWAAINGQHAIVQHLLEAGAHVNQKYNDWTALRCAAHFNQFSCCTVIINRLLQLPNDEQREKMYTFLLCMKKSGFDKNVRFHCKPFLLQAIEEENKAEFGKSIAYQEIQKVNKSRRKKLIVPFIPDYIEPDENNEWCTIL